MLDHQTILAGRWARRYAAMGFNPLPSRNDQKRPALSTYKRWLHEPIPREWLNNWNWRNIQLVCGVRWGLCCIDIDGLPGLDAWRAMVPSESVAIGQETWVCETSDTREDFTGRKIFFRLPDYPDHLKMISAPTTVLWSGNKHEEVKFIGDGGLAIVPPSIHPERKTACDWIRGPKLDHGDNPELPMISQWLLTKVLNHRKKQSPPEPQLEPLRRPRSGLARFRSDEVLAVLGDSKLDIARSYGLRTVGSGEPYLKCHAVDREDNNPSCSIDRRTGRYFDWAMNYSCSFFDLLSKLDPQTFPTWQATRDLMGAYVFGGR